MTAATTSAPTTAGWRPTPAGIVTGAITNFFDTLGIGSFATTTAISRRWRLSDDQLLPGTLNVGHALPTITQAAIFIGAVPVDRLTLITMILAACVGAWTGASIVARFSRRNVRLTMGIALSVAALLMLGSLLKLMPGGGDALGLTGAKLGFAIAGNLVLGALMTAGIGLYAPCMILVYLLGMAPTAAFPIMMGSCALLMPIASARFIREGKIDRSLAVGLAIGGVPAALFAGLVVKSLPLDAVRWLVVVVVVYTATGLLRAARQPDEVTPRA